MSFWGRKLMTEKLYMPVNGMFTLCLPSRGKEWWGYQCSVCVSTAGIRSEKFASLRYYFLASTMWKLRFPEPSRLQVDLPSQMWYPFLIFPSTQVNNRPHQFSDDVDIPSDYWFPCMQHFNQCLTNSEREEILIDPNSQCPQTGRRSTEPSLWLRESPFHTTGGSVGCAQSSYVSLGRFD